ncbi:MAG: DNA repair protein RadA [Armatimonadetes bacterium CG2_30_59_28]|nr:MAG: DNA repair protein RadA [Armatimonadetes bacterium CG2_30_59_28]PIU60373.1 MAG: DNA repair protein RadA [Armatimonadetes bacterium CG07_land_8_20_14_0_80_59_28]PIX38765.1 MAG: DNA repair protein RadA [Armatimonadetes bacterium CG_4_8_14_3_um_filter_58_9]PIY39677.1 MAG: DNA repair protein RadA [Armatimonadetes bacterium CG_4_10_14_3_um_filter_59_10]PJB63552.1 MAG: DNA repair protein RadA [Armatimonadetes bacterium CG_4_9_14_3_um_filter_58_7]
MSRLQTHFVCQSCGYESPRWLGRCHACGEYGTLVEEVVAHKEDAQSRPPPGPPRVLPLSSIERSGIERMQSGNGTDNSLGDEFDRVVGGGLVPGSVLLLGGEPGIGKSTLLLQLLAALASRDIPTLYVSGEESPDQVGLRAARLGCATDKLFVAGETGLDSVQAAFQACSPRVAVIDSIQTISNPDLASAAGTIGQIRESTAAFVRLAKETGTAILLVGHVTKDGMLAGPKAVEHMVDCVLTFEGDPHHAFRILRAAKNRFGGTHEAGIFEMHSDGLAPVVNPSQLFLENSGSLGSGVSGICVTACMEGTRPLLAEVQALVTSSYFGTPRRVTTGVDYNRCCVILAVLEKRLGLHLGAQDIHVNVVGGLRLTEPAADLAVAMSCASSFRDQPLSEGTVCFGEVGLAGEIRGVPHASRRAEEAARLGFSRCILPRSSEKIRHGDMECLSVKTLQEAIQLGLSEGI